MVRQRKVDEHAHTVESVQAGTLFVNPTAVGLANGVERQRVARHLRRGACADGRQRSEGTGAEVVGLL